MTCNHAVRAHDPSYRPEIDGLRAIAVLPVILFHAGFSWFSGGYVGVDVFFVMSGYLIAGIVLRELSAGTFSLAGFYERRARRILPALFFVMLVCLLPAWLWLMPRPLKEFGQSLVAVALFGSNFLFWDKSRYFDLAAEEKPLLHTWSLGVEEQFYLVFPLILMLLWRFGRPRLTLLLATGAVASLALAEFTGGHNPMTNFYLPHTRAWELLLGALLAFTTLPAPVHQRVGRTVAQPVAPLMQLLPAAGLGAILWAAITFDKSTPVPGVWALVPAGGAALVIAFGTRHTWVARVLSLRWLTGLGLISYSAYLWHQPLFAFARIRVLERPAPALYGLLCMTALLLAYLTWRFVETPFRDRARIRRGVLLAVSGAAALLFIAVGLLSHATGGFPQRLDAATLKLFNTAIFSTKRTACHANSKSVPAGECKYFHQNATWAVLGDSHVVEPAHALAELLRPHQQGVLHLSFSGCQPTLPPDGEALPCTPWLLRSLARLENDPRITNVLLGFRYSAHLFGDQLGVYPALPQQELRLGMRSASESRELFWNGFESITARLQRAGKRVFVLRPVPDLGRDIGANLRAHALGGIDYALGPSVAYQNTRNQFIHQKLNTLKWSKTLIGIDPAASLCDFQHCYAIIGDEAMYFDHNHLSLAGSRRVLSVLKPYIEPVLSDRK